MEIKAALAEASKSQEAQFARDWQERLKQLKAEEVSSPTCCNELSGHAYARGSFYYEA